MPEAASQLYRKKELLLRLSWKRAFSVLLALTLLLSLAACQSSGNSENPYRGKKLPVLMYHHVVEDGQECNDMTVTVSDGEVTETEKMEYLCRKSPSSSPLTTATAATTTWPSPSFRSLRPR